MWCLATPEQIKIEFAAHRLLPLCSHALPWQAGSQLEWPYITGTALGARGKKMPV